MSHHDPLKRYKAGVGDDGVWVGANACSICDKFFVPYGVGIPTEQTEVYCWGHELDPYKLRIAELEREMSALKQAQAGSTADDDTLNLGGVIISLDASAGVGHVHWAAGGTTKESPLSVGAVVTREDKRVVFDFTGYSARVLAVEIGGAVYSFLDNPQYVRNGSFSMTITD